MILTLDKIAFSEDSIVDDFGRVFFYEQRVFRAIYKTKYEYCLELLGSELFKELSVENLIPRTWVTEYELDGYSLVLEHEFISESKPHHWSFSMFKDAALLILRLNAICLKHGYELKDAHPYNVFFKRNNPIFIDLGSIVKIAGTSKWEAYAYREFINSSYIQLLIWNKSDFFLARKLIEDGNQPVLRTVPMSQILDSHLVDNIAEDLFDFSLSYKGRQLSVTSKRNKPVSLLQQTTNKAASLIFRRPVQPLAYVKSLKSQRFVENKIRGLNRPATSSSWENYHNSYKSGDTISSTPRFDRILALVKEHTGDVRSAIDLAGNQGVFCYLLSRAIELERIILTDYDEKAIDTAYGYFKKESINIQPYLFNFMRPTKREDISLLKSDIVFALAITHHLILTQQYLLPAILNILNGYSNKYVVVEFMPIGLYADGGEIPEIPDWYTADWFRSEFVKKFTLLAEEQLELNRIVFVGKKLIS